MKTRSMSAAAGSARNVSSAGGDTQLDPVGQAGEGPGTSADLSPLRADVATQQGTSLGQAPGDTHARVAGERPHLDGPACAGQPDEHGQQLSLVVTDLHPCHVPELGRLSLQLTDHTVGAPRSVSDGIGANHIRYWEAAHSRTLRQPPPVRSSPTGCRGSRLQN